MRKQVKLFAVLMRNQLQETAAPGDQNLKLDFGRRNQRVRAVDDISLTVQPGETVCLVGESGCGKSATALSIARLVPCPPGRYAGGAVLLNGQDVLQISTSQLREIRGGIVSYVFRNRPLR